MGRFGPVPVSFTAAVHTQITVIAVTQDILPGNWERPRAEASFLPAAWASKFKPAASLLLIPSSECAQVMLRTGRRGRRAQIGHGETAENENEQQDVAEKEVRSHRASNGPMLVRTPVAPSPESPIHSMLFAHARSFVVCVQAENAHHEAFQQQFARIESMLTGDGDIHSSGRPPLVAFMPMQLLARVKESAYALAPRRGVPKLSALACCHASDGWLFGVNGRAAER